MKKMPIIFCIIFVLVLFISCKVTNPAESESQPLVIQDTSTPEQQTPLPVTESPEPTITLEPKESHNPLPIIDYFPMKEDVKYVYDGEGSEYAPFTVFTDYMSVNDKRIQTRTNNGGTEVVKVLEVADGQLNMLLLKGETYYRENMLNKSNKIVEVLLKEPLITGTKWTISNNRERYISNVDVNISTKVGNFNAIEVTTESLDSKTIEYYAPKVGLVKTVFQGDEMEVTSILGEILENTPLTQKIDFYYPDINTDKITMTSNNLDFHTNEVTRIIFQEAFKDKPEGNYQPLLSKNVKIQYMYLSKDNMVYLDFNKEFVDGMNAGAGYESMILQSITNIIGNYYGIDKVYITIEGESYESGHIAMKKGEPFIVNKEIVE
jgi:hypothetical protein